tara:strand:- start:177 stop:710 length:534 start_codon:yes stop_codon:yes gene_type:complete
MSCFISSGISLGCADSLGSLKTVYILGDSGHTVSSISQTADEAISGITGVGTFYKFAVKRNTSSLTQTANKSFENGTVYYQPDLVLSFYKYDQDKRNLVKLMAQDDNLKVVVVDQNDTAYYLGEVNGMYLSAGTAETGLAVGDKNGFSLTLTGQEPNLASTLTAPLVDVVSGITVEA